MLIAVSTGMRSNRDSPTPVVRRGCIAKGCWQFGARLKNGKVRYVPMPSELSEEIRRYPAVSRSGIRFFPPKGDQRASVSDWSGSFEDLLDRAKIHRTSGFPHMICVTPFASWYMMNGGDLYELAKLLGHANIKDDRTVGCRAGTRAYHQDSAIRPR